MRRSLLALIAVLVPLWLVGAAWGQESQAAQTTRKRLKQMVDEVDAKDIGTKEFLADVLGELKDPVKFMIDNGSGVSNNSKITYKAKKVTAEQVLNDVSEKMDFGWYVISNAGNNKVDGKVMIRKSSKGKERGYEAGKEPKKKAAAPDQAEPATQPVLTVSRLLRSNAALLLRK